MTRPDASISNERLTLLSFGVKQPVAANMLMLIIILAGVIFGISLRREMFPEIQPSRATITIVYPGASPAEVEEGVALKIEDKVANLNDVDEVTTTLVEGGGSVMVEFVSGIEDIDEAVNDIKAALDTIEDLPEETEELRTIKFETVLPVITISVVGDQSERELKRAIEGVRDDLEMLPDMGEVDVYGVRNDEIRVTVRPGALLQHQLSLPDVSRRIERYMKEIPGGTVKTNVESIRIRTLGTVEHGEEIGNIVIKSDSSGAVIRLQDIADIEEGFADQDLQTRLNGLPNASATILNTNDGDTILMAEMVRAYAAGANNEPFEMDMRDRLASVFRGSSASSSTNDNGTTAFIATDKLSPREFAYHLGQQRSHTFPGKVILSDDLARFIEGRLGLLTRNAFYGAILVFLVLLLTLNLRVAIWVMTGLVVSLLGTLAFMHAIGITLNLLTMFGLIVVLGLLVDDAIVVAENIVARFESGEAPLPAAINGTRQIAWPVVATVLTTISAFLPLTMIGGQIGDFLGALPIVVACALSVSLIEALVILPAHMGHALMHAAHSTPNRVGKVFRRMESARNRFVEETIAPTFAKFVDRVVHYRYVATAIALSLWFISMGMVAGGRVAFTFFPANDSDLFVINVRMPVGTAMSRTDAIVSVIEAACVEQPEVKVAQALIGTQLDTNDWNTAGAQSHVGQIMIELVEGQYRERSSAEIIAAIREKVGILNGVSSIRYEELQGGPGGQAINFMIAGTNMQRMSKVSELLQTKLRGFEGIYDISDDMDSGQRELQIRLLDGASGLGLTPALVAEQIRGALFGLEPHQFAAHREDVKVRVLYADGARESLARLENFYIFTENGVRVPLSEVVEITETMGYATIKRLNRKRAITVLADVDQALTNPEEIVASMQPYFAELEGQFPGIRIEARGRQLETSKSMAGVQIGFVIAASLIYVILAWLFQSYFQPLAVMLGIPFAMIGVVWGHWIAGVDMMILSLIGFVALTGIVVNDSLIYMQFYNHKRDEGADIYAALVETSRRRLRPILLTTLTTVLGLLPLMLERSFQAKFLIPMAVSISFGLISATVLILLVLPCLIVIGHDIQTVIQYCWSGGKAEKHALSRVESEDGVGI